MFKILIIQEYLYYQQQTQIILFKMLLKNYDFYKSQTLNYDLIYYHQLTVI